MEMASFCLKIRHVFGFTWLTERSIGAGPPVIIQLSGLCSYINKMAESDSSSDSSVYSTANEGEESQIDSSDSEDVFEQSSVVQAYSNEPLASTSDECSSDEQTDDEDGIPSATIAQRFDGIIPVNSW